MRSVISFFLCGGIAFAQYHQDVDQAKVDAAITHGVEFLKTLVKEGEEEKHRTVGFDEGEFWGQRDSDELVLLTLICAGVPPEDPDFKILFDRCWADPLSRTYQATLMAMILEEIDRVKYQKKILQCGQFLLDNQHKSGQSGYGEPSLYADEVDVETTTGAQPIASVVGIQKAPKPKAFDPVLASEQKYKPPVTQLIHIKKMKPAGCGIRGDNSNSQYAALGFRACHDSGIRFPVENMKLARDWWLKCQHKVEHDQKPQQIFEIAGGAKPQEEPKPSSGANQATAVAPRAIIAEPQGWCYNEGDSQSCPMGGVAFGSMSAGAIGAICIYDYILGIDWKADEAVHKGLAWMTANWSVTLNPPEGEAETTPGQIMGHHFYYLYAMERVGMLFDTRYIGKNDWYKEGANYLLDCQEANGAWKESFYKVGAAQATWDTCFAILFLKRATQRLAVASGAWGDNR